LRVAALAALAPRLAQLGEPRFVLLAEQLGAEADPLLMLSAARALATAPLSKAQLLQLAEALPAAGPLAAPALVRAFEKSNDERVGLALVAALDRSAAAESLSAGELARLLARFSGRVTQAAEPLLKKLGGEDLSKQKSRLKELAGLLDPPGDAKRGRDVFFARKAGCANCHSVGSEGGRIGPDLTKIGASRAGVDLLEAVVFPSASFAREFRPYTILTDTGKTQTGVISRQTVDAIYLRTADLAEIRLPRASVEEMKESNTSIMPKGLDTLLTPGELRDLLAYLQGLR
jgi:putative heme-binding domain-containing protein